ncbi:MAG: zinc ABC transporter substrate-binding protein [Planctomycetota bacterium]
MTLRNALPTLALIVFTSLAMLGCGSGEPAADSASDEQAAGDAPIKIIATIGMLSDVVANVAGDRADVTLLVKPGVDPHLYSPTRSDIQRLLGADIVFMNGLKLEGRMDEALTSLAEAGTPVILAADQLDEAGLLGSDEYEDQFDPHVWMNPGLWRDVVEVVRDELIEFDPDGERIYRANAQTYIAQIDTLDAYADLVLDSVSESARVLISAHDAFQYFGDRFGYEVVGVQGISTEAEAGSTEIEALVDLIVERQIGAVFIESTVSDRNVQALIEGAKARGQDVIIGGELFSDAMGDEGTYEGTYVGMIDHNVTTIARALGGEAPARGLNGQLAETGE